jgi:hypothetical protein
MSGFKDSYVNVLSGTHLRTKREFHQPLGNLGRGNIHHKGYGHEGFPIFPITFRSTQSQLALSQPACYYCQSTQLES